MTSATRPMRRRAGETPIWKQIHDTLAADIASGALAPGDRLPAEPELGLRFGVNRLTIRQAIASLQEAGYLRVERGRGTFVQHQILPYGLGQRVSFSQNLIAAKRLPSRRLVESRTLPADADVARALKIRAGARVILIGVIGDADGQPILYGLNHYPAARFDGLAEAFEREGSLTKALEAFGAGDYRRESTELIARLPTALEARYLAQPKVQPIVETRAVDVDADGCPIAYGVTCFAAGRIRFVLQS